MQQRRKHNRVPLDLPASYRIGDAEPASTRVVDMSMGGANLSTEETIPFGTKLVLSIELPEMKAKLQVNATVRWDKPGGTGVQFGTMGAKDTYLVTEFLAGRTPKSDSPVE